MKKPCKPIASIKGHRYGALVVFLREQSEDLVPRGHRAWWCRCDCGSDVLATESNLKTGKTRRCQTCSKKEKQEAARARMIGNKFNRLTVISQAPSKQYGRYFWECSCECGGRTTVPTNRLIHGTTKSCGCLHAETASKTALRVRPSDYRACVKSRQSAAIRRPRVAD